MKSIWALSGMVFCASGCALSSVETTRLNAAPRPLAARPARSVEIYSSSPPTRPHVDVALLRADQANFGTDTPAMLRSLAERAGELGCDALFVSGASERSASRADFSIVDPGSHNLFATCIAYLPPSPTDALAAASSAVPAGNALVLLPPGPPKPVAPAIVAKVVTGDVRR